MGPVPLGAQEARHPICALFVSSSVYASRPGRDAVRDPPYLRGELQQAAEHVEDALRRHRRQGLGKGRGGGGGQ